LVDTQDPAEQRHCIITGDPITKENDSKAHVIPSALGGRLKPRGILSIRGNGILEEKIDYPLVEAFQALMNLLNGSRDRGEVQPTRMTDERGKTYLFQFGEPLTLARPEYEETPGEGGPKITIKARTLREARILLGRVKAKHPDFDIDEAMSHAVTDHQWPDGMLNRQFQIGPRIVFPAVFVAASIFAVYHGQNAHPKLKAYVDSFNPEDPVMPPDTFSFIPEERWITTTAEVTHILALAGDVTSGRLLAYVEIFNLARVAVILTLKGSQDIRKTHAVDVLKGIEIPACIDEAALRATPWRQTHRTGDESILVFTKARFDELVALAQRRAWDDLIERMIARALGRPDGRPLTSEHIANVTGEVAAFLKVWWKNPATNPDTRQSGLEAFDGLCSQLANFLPRARHRELYGLVVEQRRDLVRAAEAGQSGVATG